MKILIIMHVESEGPGTLGECLESAGAKMRYARLYLGDPLPADLGAIDAVVTLGGPMNVYEEAAYPFLPDETRFLQEAAARNLPVLGICLGAQLIAKAAGAPVTKNSVREAGWGFVTLTEEGVRDPLFRDLPPTLPVLQLHEDTFAVPDGGTLLAVGRECRNQAFRWRNMVGLQFHLEVTRPMLKEWFAGAASGPEILRRYDGLIPELGRSVRNLCSNFLSLVANRPV